MTNEQNRQAPDQGAVAGLASLRDVAPPPSLLPGVMQRIANPPPPSFWSWLRRRRRLELRLTLSPLGAGAMLATGAAALALVVGSWSDRRPSMASHAIPVSVPQTAGASTVLVRFTLVARGAKKVAIAGDFNGWDPDRGPLLPQDGGGTFAGTVPLPAGTHEYMFVVDGQWVTDPAASERRPDGFGRTNAVLRL